MISLSKYKLKDIHIGMQVQHSSIDYLGFITCIQAFKNIFAKDEYIPIITIRWILANGYYEDKRYLNDCLLIYPTGNTIDLGV